MAHTSASLQVYVKLQIMSKIILKNQLCSSSKLNELLALTEFKIGISLIIRHFLKQKLIGTSNI